tara:strand:+ start:326 stop:544 length:219 start_codon:yes stop_codon:yes gene_type:complete
MKKNEARLLSYELLFTKEGQLVTQRTSTDITKLKKYFTKEEYKTLEATVKSATNFLNEVHNRIEAELNARKV